MPRRVGEGLISRNTRHPCSPNATIPSPNRTASRACRRQYPARQTSSPATPPVTFDTNVTRGAEYFTPPASRSSSPSTGSISPE